ncbi:WRKY transcription factor 23-like [Impatiens glandulifera]|uniref:WRKY transcription factor 23-like n=1 Tax=Impatiens glandulifera TaxID=253017 RepID=UPI001FB17276|nr:WRKY transcription factor 23-like [Impatiens glandulifera]
MAPSTSGQSTSISSSSTEVTNDTKTTCEDQHEQDDDGDQEKNMNKHHELKPKKKNTKRPRQPRFAFMTKSDVDHLDDGYRWRKYGQKGRQKQPFSKTVLPSFCLPRRHHHHRLAASMAVRDSGLLQDMIMPSLQVTPGGAQR